MSIASDVLMGLAMRFTVTIDNSPYDLGSWSKASGLEVSWDLAEHRAGDSGNDRWYYPGIAKYPNVKLTRPVTKATADKIPMWLTSLAKGVQRKTATIEARTVMGEVIVAWGLTGVVPVRWTGPQFTLDSPKVATETLELAHHGFIGPGWGG